MARFFVLLIFLANILYSVETVKIGVLAKRGYTIDYNRWKATAEYLNKEVPGYTFEIIPLNFEELSLAVSEKKVDFVITNTMYYVILESRHGISRIATLKNNDGNGSGLTRFGGVILTRSDNDEINRLDDLKGHCFGAVNINSFGGWVMAQKELQDYGIQSDDFKCIKFFNTHDRVVKAILNGEIEAGTVRTDTLERMAKEGKINLSSIKIIAPKHYKNFKYAISTKLYPEWPFAQLSHVNEALANHVLIALLKMLPDSNAAKSAKIEGWTIPLDYTAVHHVLKELNRPPYRKTANMTLADVLYKYKYWIIAVLSIFVMLTIFVIYIRTLNRQLKKLNVTLEEKVEERTLELHSLNQRLSVLADTDALTGIYNRRSYIREFTVLFERSRSNNNVFYLSIFDLDWFKKVNDTYGHSVGDEVLKEFVYTINRQLNEGDIFGRIGGEEFSLCCIRESEEDMLQFCERLRLSVEQLEIFTFEGYKVTFTVSIGVSKIHQHEVSIDSVFKRADEALYEAKELGRNTCPSDDFQRVVGSRFALGTSKEI